MSKKFSVFPSSSTRGFSLFFELDHLAHIIINAHTPTITSELQRSALLTVVVPCALVLGPAVTRRYSILVITDLAVTRESNKISWAVLHLLVPRARTVTR